MKQTNLTLIKIKDKINKGDQKKMELKRYDSKELITICTDIFYNYMANENQLFWFDNEFKPLEKDCKTPADQLHARYIELLNQNKNRVDVYRQALQSGEVYEESRQALETQINFLFEEQEALEKSCMKFQKELYEKTNSVDYCRSCVRIPLDKIINSYYDDLILEIVFYDDIGTLKGKYNDYKVLKTLKERKEFIKNNTEITHLGFAYFNNGRHITTIGISGKLNIADPRIKLAPFVLLDHKFSDFRNLTLADTNSIQNNDLRQFLQSKIDMDKENLEKLSSQMIRGDLYEIYKSENDFFIRYVCRSTGRVYYNSLVLNNLKLSKEYEEDNYDSYARAWWNLNTLGGKVDGKPVIRL